MLADTYNGPLLIFQKGSGRTHPEDAMATTCEIYADRIEIKRRIVRGKLASMETRNLDFELTGLRALIDEAARGGKLVKKPGPADIPFTIYKAIHVDTIGRPLDVILLQTGRHNATNKSPSAKALKNFLDMHCP